MGLKDKIRKIIEDDIRHKNDPNDYGFDMALEEADMETDNALQTLAIIAVELKDMSYDETRKLIKNLATMTYDESGYLIAPNEIKPSEPNKPRNWRRPLRP